jgi:hypothetical protein
LPPIGAPAIVVITITRTTTVIMKTVSETGSRL